MSFLLGHNLFGYVGGSISAPAATLPTVDKEPAQLNSVFAAWLNGSIGCQLFDFHHHLANFVSDRWQNLHKLSGTLHAPFSQAHIANATNLGFN